MTEHKPNPATARLHSVGLSRGTNQSGVRVYNERLVLSLIRSYGSLPKAEIARLTGLSAQTISVIIKQLEADALLVREEPRRGRIGQPSVPFSLNPDGAFFVGLKIGRRSSDLVLLDLAGRVRHSLHETYAYPVAGAILDFVGAGLGSLLAEIGPAERRRVSGLGIAAPFELWNWEEQSGAPKGSLEHWRTTEIREEIACLVDWPVYYCNDATAACAAELVLGNPRHYLDFLYVFVGSFVGGGVVLNGSLYPGRTGNAGAIGSMPIPAFQGRGRPEQLIHGASIYVLEERLVAAGRDPSVLWRVPDDWGDVGPLLGRWTADAAESLAIAVVAAISTIDFQAVIVDGAFPPAVRAELVEQLARKVAALDLQGLSPVEIVEGRIGSKAREIGGACLPLLANFSRDREVLFREA